MQFFSYSGNTTTVRIYLDIAELIFGGFQHCTILNNKFAVANLVEVEIDESSNETLPKSGAARYIGKIICPLCSQIISVSHTFEPLPSGNCIEPLWDTSKLDEHVKLHENDPNFEIEEETCEYFILSADRLTFALI